jgi:general secretion pathway protein A
MEQRAEAEISGKTYTAQWLRWLTPLLAVTAVAIVAVGAWALLSGQRLAGNQAETARRPPTPAEATEETARSAGTSAAISSAAADPIAATPAAAPVVDPGPTLDDELLLAADLTDRETAFSSLFRLWGLPTPASPDGCAAALQAGLECLEQRGSWTSLRQFDRPAILTLTDSRGDNHAVVLTGIDGDQARLSVGGVDVVHPIDEVSNAWFGDFLLLWQPANGESLALGPGSDNGNVVWLRERLADIDVRYRAEPLSSRYYDVQLQDKVREFQRDNRLAVDGVAGSHTQIVINSLTAGSGVPRLSVLVPERS